MKKQITPLPADPSLNVPCHNIGEVSYPFLDQKIPAVQDFQGGDKIIEAKAVFG